MVAPMLVMPLKSDSGMRIRLGTTEMHLDLCRLAISYARSCCTFYPTISMLYNGTDTRGSGANESRFDRLRGLQETTAQGNGLRMLCH
jgi:hypothetical protein